DGMPDAYEAAHNFNLSLNDANNDADGDNYSNLEEMIGGTDPRSASVFPGPPRVTYLSSTDKHAQVTLSADRLGVTYGVVSTEIGVRSDTAVQPGSGFFYFEGRRMVQAANYGF